MARGPEFVIYFKLPFLAYTELEGLFRSNLVEIDGVYTVLVPEDRSRELFGFCKLSHFDIYADIKEAFAKNVITKDEYAEAEKLIGTDYKPYYPAVHSDNLFYN